MLTPPVNARDNGYTIVAPFSLTCSIRRILSIIRNGENPRKFLIAAELLLKFSATLADQVSVPIFVPGRFNGLQAIAVIWQKGT